MSGQKKLRTSPAPGTVRLHETERFGYDPTMTNHDRSNKHPEPKADSEDEPVDPRSREPQGDEGIPATLIDTPHNMPGDQPVDDTPPSRLKATGDA